MLLHEGQKIRGTYEVERFLGEGAFAEVYRVKHRFLGRQALKVFKLLGMTTSETVDVLSEAVILSQLGHPNIVRVFDANITETPKGPGGFFTMEYVAGGTLDQFWHSHGQKFVPIETSVEIIKQVCRGISVAHNEDPPLIHRDIKPQNILVGYDGSGLRVKVSDFGLAKRVNPLTLLATTRGTRSFKPPEAFSECGTDSPAADVWAIGSVLYLLLTDRLPYSNINDSEIFDDGRFERELIPASQYNIQVDIGLDQILNRALALESKNRYQSSVQMLVDIEKWKWNPQAPIKNKKLVSRTDDSKFALGPHSEIDFKAARKMSQDALKLSKHVERLMDAADLMEQALNKAPQLRDEYEYQLRLWRRGVVM